jgi:hypothetical protein
LAESYNNMTATTKLPLPDCSNPPRRTTTTSLAVDLGNSIFPNLVVDANMSVGP